MYKEFQIITRFHGIISIRYFSTETEILEEIEIANKKKFEIISVYHFKILKKYDMVENKLKLV